MIEEFGTVKSLGDGTAVVLVPKKSACEGCTAGTCRTEDQSMEIEALNRVGALVGQRVKVVIAPVTYMKGSLIVYGLPALALILGAVAGKEWVSGIFPGSDPDIVSALVGFGAMFLALGAVKLWSHAVPVKTANRPVIEEIMQ